MTDSRPLLIFIDTFGTKTARECWSPSKKDMRQRINVAQPDERETKGSTLRVARGSLGKHYSVCSQIQHNTRAPESALIATISLNSVVAASTSSWSFALYSISTTHPSNSQDNSMASGKPNKLAFLSMPAPASYVAGLGRGCVHNPKLPYRMTH